AFENIYLEELPPSKPNNPEHAHFRIGSKGSMPYQDNKALYPHVQIANCPNLSVYLGGSAANLTVTDSTIDRCTAAVDGPLRGTLNLQNCRLAPQINEGTEPIYALDAELGTYLTNCTVHAPRIAGVAKPDQADRLEFIQPNKRVRFYQLNTA